LSSSSCFNSTARAGGGGRVVQRGDDGVGGGGARRRVLRPLGLLEHAVQGGAAGVLHHVVVAAARVRLRVPRVEPEDVRGDARLHRAVIPRRRAAEGADGEQVGVRRARDDVRGAGEELRAALLERVHDERGAVEAVVRRGGAE